MELAQNNLEKDLNEIDWKIEISIKKGRGKKQLTSVAGLDQVERPERLPLAKFLKIQTTKLKKQFVCGGFIDNNNVITLNGDHREEIKKYILEKKMAKEDQIKVHGY
jgi:translation initiation factor SUI1